MLLLAGCFCVVKTQEQHLRSDSALMHRPVGTAPDTHQTHLFYAGTEDKLAGGTLQYSFV